MKVLIDNEEVVCSNDFTIVENMLQTSSVILNNVYPAIWDSVHDYSSSFYFPKDYSKCVIYDDDENVIFAGIVRNTGNINLNPREPHYASVQVLDFKDFLSQGETLEYVIANKTITEAITQLVGFISDYGFVVGNIDIPNDSVIGAYSTQNKTPYDVLQYLSTISQTKWTTRLLSDFTVAIDMYDPLLQPLKDTILYNNTYFTQNDIIDMQYSYSTNDYRNKQVVTSEHVYSSISNQEIVITYKAQTIISTSVSIGKINSILLNNVSMTVATQNEKNNGITADFYYSPNEMFIEANTTIKNGDEIIIDYVPIIKGRQIVTNISESNRIQASLDRKGVIARYEERSDATTTQELIEIGKSYIKYKGSCEVTLTIKSRKNLYNIGDRIQFNAPLQELSKEYMVKTKQTNYIVTANEIFYTFTLTSSFNDENAVNYFDNQRNKLIGNIGQGEYITRNIDVENTTNIIFYGLEVKND